MTNRWQDKFVQIIRAGNQDLQDSLSSLRAEVKSLRAELADRDATIVNLRGEIQRLREDHDALEQYGRRNNLRVSGIPEPNLQQGETEDTTGIYIGSHIVLTVYQWLNKCLRILFLSIVCRWH